MKNTIRAWKDRDFRASLEKDAPQNPAGVRLISREEIAIRGGGVTASISINHCTALCTDTTATTFEFGCHTSLMTCDVMNHCIPKIPTTI